MVTPDLENYLSPGHHERIKEGCEYSCVLGRPPAQKSKVLSSSSALALSSYVTLDRLSPDPALPDVENTPGQPWEKSPPIGWYQCLAEHKHLWNNLVPSWGYCFEENIHLSGIVLSWVTLKSILFLCGHSRPFPHPIPHCSSLFLHQCISLRLTEDMAPGTPSVHISRKDD